MKRISSTVLTILLVLSVLLAGCNSGSFKSSCFIAKDSRLTEQDKLLVAGSYKLKSIGGMSPEDYYKNLASNSDSDPDVERTWHTEEELNARIEQVSLLILNPDGTAFYPSFLGGYLSGEWYREGEDVFVTVYGTGFEGTGTIESHTVVLKDSVFQLKFDSGELKMLVEGEAEFVYTRVSSSGGVPNPLDIEALLSAAGTYKVELIDGKDAVDYYSEKEGMEVSSLETLKDEMSFTLHPDGSVSFAAIPEWAKGQRGSWTQNGSKVTVELSNDSFSYAIYPGNSILCYGTATIHYTLQGDMLTTTIRDYGKKRIVFKRN